MNAPEPIASRASDESGTSMPRTPQPDVGRIYPLTMNHGTHVFVSRSELNRADFILNKVFFVGVCGVLVLVLLGNTGL